MQMIAIYIYMVALAGVFVLAFFLTHLFSRLLTTARWLSTQITRFFAYHFVIGRHRLIGPWTASSLVVHMLYIVSNGVCLCHRSGSLSVAASRAGTLSLANLAPVILGIHLSFLADVVGVSLRTCRRIHRSCGLMATFLLLAHGLFKLFQKPSFSFSDWPSRYAAMGLLAAVSIILVSLFQLRRFSYELFLRLHQSLSIFFIFCVLTHIDSVEKKNWTWLPVIVFAGCFCFISVSQLIIIVYRNKAWHEPSPRMVVRQNHGYIEATLNLPRTIRFLPGQYIVVWVPSVSLFESHPFMVTSWSPTGQKRIRLLIKPREGFTDKLLRRSKSDAEGYIAHRVFFSGPHGRSAPVTECKAVVIFAEGNGLSAVLAHVKKLIHHYKTGKGRTKRIHLIWLVHSEDEIKAKEDYINEILVDDGLENGYVLLPINDFEEWL
ncbi:hypothetical protein FCULG_00012563 [Fusarium culmorum]|uniref:ferric-chelate reductase (NADPH) n=1 Tax=Fusarium culmorum TaxID=5516 RepID=A0A2T4GG91_FUSCU|nr:hypothetical protein FCULG_00012846 [Fusarium culmorum]PTD02549.1 hypothetical protein FCULG_00012563 [Fusarium culmorum]